MCTKIRGVTVDTSGFVMLRVKNDNEKYQVQTYSKESLVFEITVRQNASLKATKLEAVTLTYHLHPPQQRP